MKAVPWLQAAIVFTQLSGFVTVATSVIAPDALSAVVGALFLPPVEPRLDAVGRLLGSIAGASLLGWSTTLWLLVRHVDDLGPALLGRAIATGVVVWFVADTAASLVLGAYLNVPGNLVYLALLLPPAWLLGRKCEARASALGQLR